MAKVTTDKVVWCDAGWFRHVLHYGFCPTEAAWNKELARLGRPNELYPSSDAHCLCLTDDDNKYCCIVTVRDGLEKTYSALEISCMVFHEAVHVWQFLKERIGEEDPGAEMEAYALQSIAQELLYRFEQTRKELKDCGR